MLRTTAKLAFLALLVVAGAAGLMFNRRDTTVAQLNGGKRRRAFLHAWVRYEARLKWHSVRLERASSTAPEARSPGTAEPWMAAWDLARGAAALAVEQAPRELRLWRWRPGTVHRATSPA